MDVRITRTVEVGEVNLTLDVGMSCGLLISELVSNSLKHAFPGGRTGIIHISLQPANHRKITLTVSDNGIGYTDIDAFKAPRSLGSELISALAADHLGGTIELQAHQGTTVTIVFEAGDDRA